MPEDLVSGVEVLAPSPFHHRAAQEEDPPRLCSPFSAKLLALGLAHRSLKALYAETPS